MSEDEIQFTKLQLEFLDLWEIAARYDCLYLIDFHCEDLFDHDQTSALTDEERAQVARAAQREIFGEAMERGYRPKDADQLYGDLNGKLSRPLC